MASERVPDVVEEHDMVGGSRELPPVGRFRVRWCAMCRDVEWWDDGWRAAPRWVLRDVLRARFEESNHGE